MENKNQAELDVFNDAMRLLRLYISLILILWNGCSKLSLFLWILLKYVYLS